MGLRGIVRGRRGKTTRAEAAGARPLDRGHRQFQVDRPNALWGSDLTSAAPGQGVSSGAFGIDADARRIVGWRGSASLSPERARDALEPARYARLRGRAENLVHHSDRGGPYVSIRYPERLTQGGLEPSVGSGGDSYDNAVAAAVIGLYQTELIGPGGPWRPGEAVELAPLAGVDGFHPRRLLEPRGHRPPAEVEAAYDEQASAIAA